MGVMRTFVYGVEGGGMVGVLGSRLGEAVKCGAERMLGGRGGEIWGAVR